MEWTDDVVSALDANGIDLAASLPDAALDPLLSTLEREERIETVTATREEEAVGIISGAWLGGRRGALVCQSSGLATTVNALSSLNKPARIPFLGVVSRRGDLGEFNLAQVPFGYAAPEVLDEIGIRNRAVTDREEVGETVDLAAKTAFSTEEPYVLFLDATVTGAKDEF
jgi:sulfopyruvate decarboxylase subunit alpha